MVGGVVGYSVEDASGATAAGPGFINGILAFNDECAAETKGHAV